MKQLKAAYRLEGASTVIHGNTGRSPANKIDCNMRGKIISLKKMINIILIILAILESCYKL